MSNSALSIKGELLQVKLSAVDSKTGTLKGLSFEIGNSFIDEVNLSLESAGYDGRLSVTKLRLGVDAMKKLLSMTESGAVKVDVLFKQQKYDEETCKQLFLSGFLTDTDSMDYRLNKVSQDVKEGNNASVDLYVSVDLSLSFCDPLQYWAKQISLRSLSSSTTYKSLITDAFSDVSSTFMKLEFDKEFAAMTQERRVIFSLMDESSTLYDYLNYVLVSYQGRLRVDYQVLKKTEKELSVKDGILQNVEWPKNSVPTYHVESALDKPKTNKSQDRGSKESSAKEGDLSNFDFTHLRYLDVKAGYRNTYSYQFENTSAMISAPQTYPDKIETKLKRTLGLSAPTKAVFDQSAKLKLKQLGASESSGKVIYLSFSQFPDFAVKKFMLDEIELSPSIKEEKECKTFNIFGDKKGALLNEIISIKRSNRELSNGDVLTLDDLSDQKSMLHDIDYVCRLMDDEICNSVLLSYLKGALPFPSHHKNVEGVIVTSSKAQKEDTDKNQAKCLYKINCHEVKKPIEGISYDKLEKNAKTYWVKIPEFENAIIEVPAIFYTTHAQQYLPLKSGTKIKLKCFLEYAEVDEILNSNLGEVSDENKQNELYFWGGKQEMFLKATSNEHGKEQLLSFGVEEEGDEAFSHVLAFDVKSGATTIKCSE